MSKIRRRHRTQAKKERSAKPHKVWQLQEAKARFSELVKEVEEDGYHTITRNGHPVVMVISTREFEKLSTPENSLLDFFRESPLPDFDIDTERDKDTGRETDL
jgi:prevent-host-death family protein